MANYETILADKKDGVVTITFNRPEQKNAMIRVVVLGQSALQS